MGHSKIALVALKALPSLRTVYVLFLIDLTMEAGGNVRIAGFFDWIYTT